MSPNQHLVEILPDFGPGSVCFLAKMMGVPYYPNKCEDCKPNEKWNGQYATVRKQYTGPPFSETVKVMGKWVGNIVVEEIVEIVQRILYPSLESIAQSHNIDCFEV